MRHSDYINLMRDIAIAHLGIQHSQTEKHFARITLRSDPFGGRGYIGEFVNSLRNHHFPLMLAVTYYAQYQGENSDQTRKIIQGGFVLLDKAPQEDFDDINEVYDRMEEYSQDVLTYLREAWQDDPTVRVFDLNGTTSEKIGPVGDNLFGEITLFPLPTVSCASLYIDTDKFDAALLTNFHGAEYQLPDFL